MFKMQLNQISGYILIEYFKRNIMANIQVASGQQIYDAAVEGAKRKFNRSTDDYSVYESMLHEFYEMMLTDNNNKAACDRALGQWLLPMLGGSSELAVVPSPA
jgi:hypothetical protein